MIGVAQNDVEKYRQRDFYVYSLQMNKSLNDEEIEERIRSKIIKLDKRTKNIKKHLVEMENRFRYSSGHGKNIV